MDRSRLDACADGLGQLYRRFDAFEESKHKREGGKFSSTGGGSNSSEAAGGAGGGGEGSSGGGGPPPLSSGYKAMVAKKQAPDEGYHEFLTGRGFERTNHPPKPGTSPVYKHPSGHEVSVDPSSGEFAAYSGPRKGAKPNARSSVTTGGAQYHTGGKGFARLQKVMSDPRYKD